MLFFVQNGNPERIEELKTVAKRRLKRYAKKSPLKDKYEALIEKIENNKYDE